MNTQPNATAFGSADLADYCAKLARRTKCASRVLASATGETKNRWLERAAAALAHKEADVLQANARDLAKSTDFGLTAAQIDRLTLNPARIGAMIEGLHAVRALPDPIGRVLHGEVRPNGLEIRKVSVPLGVLFFIYESRPNVTADAAALAIKSGNAIILRGGKEAMHSNRAIHHILQIALTETGLPADGLQLVEVAEREAISCLLNLNQYVDLAIPRGGEGLIRLVAKEATMPVMKHFQGNCHVYVDRDADLDMAERILINAKCQRPGVCNAAESLLVHWDVAATFLPRAARLLRQNGVELRGCPRTCELVEGVTPATDADFAAEFLDLIISIKIVDSLDDAIAHIGRFGTGHTEAIVTRDLEAARRFVAGVDAAAVMVNASTRFHDGFEFGLGAEIGISTDKFHARGPCGLVELTSYKYTVFGDGQVRP